MPNKGTCVRCFWEEVVCRVLCLCILGFHVERRCRALAQLPQRHPLRATVPLGSGAHSRLWIQHWHRAEAAFGACPRILAKHINKAAAGPPQLAPLADTQVLTGVCKRLLQLWRHLNETEPPPADLASRRKLHWKQARRLQDVIKLLSTRPPPGYQGLCVGSATTLPPVWLRAISPALLCSPCVSAVATACFGRQQPVAVLVPTFVMYIRAGRQHNQAAGDQST